MRLKATTLFLAIAGLCVLLLDPAISETQSGNSASNPPAPLSLSERRGKQIYLYGTSPSGGNVTAFLRDAAVEVPASTLTCANCHGFRGEGKPEGGVIPSVITWSFLTKSYGVTHASGRTHPPYDEKTLELSLVRGFDPAGTRLAGSMPVYQMPPEDMKDLIAYLKRLGSDIDPGVSDNALRIGTIIPGDGPARDAGVATRAALEAYFAEVNAHGGIYGRKVDLRSLDAKSGTGASEEAEQFIRNEGLFALAGAFIAGSEAKLLSIVEKEEVPLVGPFTLFPSVEFPVNRHVFYLLSGLNEQALAMLSFAASKTSEPRRVAIVYPRIDRFVSVVPTIEAECQKRSWPAPEKLAYATSSFDAAQIASRVKASRADVVLVYTNANETVALANAVSATKWTPSFFIPGALVGRELLNAQPGLLASFFVSFPTLPLDQTQQGIAEYHQLAKKHSLPQRHLASQVNALGAAKVLVEALKLAGRDLSREKLINTLEGLYQYQTGLTPPITFGLNRRIGALGAYIVSIDPEKKEFVPVSNWIALN
ncbi:MAG TPA: ABC transporter substrate-binding protein [Blastocatellia bacterium]|nr:ABC transporter substrate-binding protein [Blastocatellia bacterium]